jgi:type I restriction enzyme S subunit
VPPQIDWDAVPYCTIEEKDFDRYRLQPGDVVVARTGATVGYAKLIRDQQDAVFASYLVRFRFDKSKVDPGYAGRILESDIYKKFVLSRVGGAAQPNANAKVLSAFPLPVPPLRTQQLIATILSAYDDLIENNRRRIQLLEQAARLLYKEWFVHLRFPGREHVNIKNGVPEGWEKKKLGDIMSTNTQSYQARELPDEINYIDISSVTRGRVLTKTVLSSTEAPGRARRKAKSGDVLWSNVRPNLRAYALVLDPEENDVFSTGFTVLSPVAVPFSYLYLLVTTDEFVSHLVNHATGAGYPAVRPGDFERSVVLVPPSRVLELFHEKTEPLFRLVSVLDKEIEPLTSARDLLLPRLMSGELAA